MDKLIKDLYGLNWEFISGVFELAFKLGLPVAIVLIKPWREFFANAISGIKFLSDMRNPQHDLYYEGMVLKVKTLHNEHEEKNSEKVKQLENIIAQYEARDKAKEKEGIETLQEGFGTLQQSFNKLEGNVENALESIVKQGAQIKKGESNIIKMYRLIQKQEKDLLELKNNQNRKAA
jgi:hypothetical protein